MKSFILGLNNVAEGFSLLTKPGIKRYVMIPVLINIALFVCFFLVLQHFVGMANVWFNAHVPEWLQWLSAVLWLLFFISFFIIFIYTFITISNIVAAPFNSILSEKIELFITGKPLNSASLWAMFKDIPRMIGRQILVLVYYFPRVILLLILFFVPVVQIIAPLLWFIFHAWYMSLTYLDYPTDNHRIPFIGLQSWVRENRLVTLGLGSGILLISSVPFLNFFAMPVGVAAATKTWAERTK